MELWQLRQKQGLPLETKIIMSQKRIQEFYEYCNGNVYISYSGGKDSTVLLHLVRQLYPKAPALFVNTGLEYPELVDFVRQTDNVQEIRPLKSFNRVIKENGFPVVSKKTARIIRELQNPTEKNQNTRRLYLEGIKSDGTKSTSFKLAERWKMLLDAPFKVSEKCCYYMKKEPFKRYEKESKRYPFIGMLASDGDQRESTYLKKGCNNYSNNHSNPMGIWKEEDIWEYIKVNNLAYPSVYDQGLKRTGCMFCMFGVHLEKEPNRFQQMQLTHPTQYKYCMEKLGLKHVLEYIGVPYRRQGILDDYL